MHVHVNVPDVHMMMLGILDLVLGESCLLSLHLLIGRGNKDSPSSTRRGGLLVAPIMSSALAANEEIGPAHTAATGSGVPSVVDRCACDRALRLATGLLLRVAA